MTANPLVNRTAHSRLRRLRSAGYQQRWAIQMQEAECLRSTPVVGAERGGHCVASCSPFGSQRTDFAPRSGPRVTTGAGPKVICLARQGQSHRLTSVSISGCPSFGGQRTGGRSSTTALGGHSKACAIVHGASAFACGSERACIGRARPAQPFGRADCLKAAAHLKRWAIQMQEAKCLRSTLVAGAERGGHRVASCSPFGSQRTGIAPHSGRRCTACAGSKVTCSSRQGQSHRLTSVSISGCPSFGGQRTGERSSTTTLGAHSKGRAVVHGASAFACGSELVSIGRARPAQPFGRADCLKAAAHLKR